MEKMSSKSRDFLTVSNIYLRKNANEGFWVSFLLPLAIIVTTFKHIVILTPVYKTISIFATGLLFTALAICLQYRKYKKWALVDLRTITATIITATLFCICLHKNLTFAILSAVCCTIFYSLLQAFVVTRFKEIFSLGEAAISTQALLLLIYSTYLNLYEIPKRGVMQISTIIIQFWMFGIFTIAFLAYSLKVKSPILCYTLIVFTIFFITLLPLHVFINGSPILWVINRIIENQTSIILVAYWFVCVLFAAVALHYQISIGAKASTSIRKIFHLLVAAVFIPGFYFKCSLLYLACGGVLGILVLLDMIRVLDVPPLSSYLQEGFLVYSDEKDVVFSLTPVYLFCGCCLPMWIHPAPCDLTDSATFSFLPLLSGVLSVGLGDTAASFIGSRYGRLKWPNSQKSIEGTIACILSQLLLIYLLVTVGCLPHLKYKDFLRIVFAVCTVSVVEARTTQVDNLVLPLIMYALLI